MHSKWNGYSICFLKSSIYYYDVITSSGVVLLQFSHLHEITTKSFNSINAYVFVSRKIRF